MKKFLSWFAKRVANGVATGAVTMLTIAGISFALTYNWSDPTSIRNKISGNTLTSTGWNLLVGNVDNLNERVTTIEGNGVPTGTVIAYNGTSCPTGWTEAAWSGVPTGVGGSSTLDLRGEFPRGWDHGRGVDSGRTLASFQQPTSFPSIYVYSSSSTNGTLVTHPINTNSGYPNDNTALNFDSATYGSGPYMNTSLAAGWAVSLARFTARPRNVALLYCVKN